MTTDTEHITELHAANDAEREARHEFTAEIAQLTRELREMTEELDAEKQEHELAHAAWQNCLQQRNDWIHAADQERVTSERLTNKLREMTFARDTAHAEVEQGHADRIADNRVLLSQLDAARADAERLYRTLAGSGLKSEAVDAVLAAHRAAQVTP